MQFLLLLPENRCTVYFTGRGSLHRLFSLWFNCSFVTEVSALFTTGGSVIVSAGFSAFTMMASVFIPFSGSCFFPSRGFSASIVGNEGHQ
jgi:cyanophycinase-like exopeptidase